ncbi:MAG: hypothetical protein OEX00_03060 [Gammaproteobacteria bacterium]|nr:hypothetical protein [Gammaproteobacteria bacterium]MDH5693563.1 hypothetical protein [Gammaproteobacteria bacterium]
MERLIQGLVALLFVALLGACGEGDKEEFGTEVQFDSYSLETPKVDPHSGLISPSDVERIVGNNDRITVTWRVSGEPNYPFSLILSSTKNVDESVGEDATSTILIDSICGYQEFRICNENGVLVCKFTSAANSSGKQERNVSCSNYDRELEKLVAVQDQVDFGSALFDKMFVDVDGLPIIGESTGYLIFRICNSAGKSCSYRRTEILFRDP